MAAKTTAEKMERIAEAWHKDQNAKLIYEWIKTGNISLSEFRTALDLIAGLEQMATYYIDDSAD